MTAGQRVGRHEQPPRRLVVARLGVVEPTLDVLAGRAGAVARREPRRRRRGARSATSRCGWQAGADVEGDGERALHRSVVPVRRGARAAVAGDVAVGDRPGCAATMSGRAPASARRGGRSAAAARRYSSTGTRRRIGDTAVTSPSSASNTGKSPDSLGQAGQLDGVARGRAPARAGTGRGRAGTAPRGTPWPARPWPRGRGGPPTVAVAT